MPDLMLPPDQPFDLDRTLGCGQVFRWEKKGRWWSGIVGKNVIRICQEGRTLTWHGAKEEFIRDYFQVDLDLVRIIESIDRDPLIHAALKRCEGLRVIRQPAWECLGSYICATYANIPGIRKRISLLSESFGERIRIDGEWYSAFPSAEQLAEAALCDVKDCRLGYRAPYICETARTIAADPDWESRIALLPYSDARKELLRLKGVGKKVADCVLLFAFGKFEAFPVDVWIMRIMRQAYPERNLPENYDLVARNGRELFGPYAGYAQEYLFCDRTAITGKQVNPD
jgi:N-glycosylase/DNA lyase